MGLFGGFKAKFSSDSVAKNEYKSSKKNDVVCLGYRVFSEFDTQQQRSESSTAINPSPSVGNHTLKNLNESTTNATKTSAPVIPKPKVKKEKPATESKTSNGIVTTNETVEFIKVEPKIDATYIEGKTSTFNPAPKKTKKTAPKSILKTKSSVEVKDYNSTESENHLASLDNINNLGLKSDNTIDSIKNQQTFSAETVKYSKSTRTTSGSFVSQVSTHLQKSDTTYTNDGVSISTSVSQAKVGVSQTRGISNTSNVAASLFFADDDDDDYEANENANRRSVEC